MNYSEQYISDLVRIQTCIPNLKVLKKKTILVTGATGLIGSAIVDFLLYLNNSQETEVHIYAASRNYEKFLKRFDKNKENQFLHFFQYDALQEIHSDILFDYYIHAASNANPSLYVREPVETMLANLLGIKNILEHARNNTKARVLYVSSSEVYGKKDDNLPYSENDYNYVDILNPRACYPSSKRAAETLCVAYSQEYNLDTVIVRPGHVYGPTMTESDTRASSQFPRDVLQGKDIVMKSAGTQLRSYCYVLDCVAAILTVLLSGKKAEAYNISNSNSVVTIREMAECFARRANKKVIFENPSDFELKGYNMMDNSSLSSSKLEALGWKGIFDLDTGVQATLNCL